MPPSSKETELESSDQEGGRCPYDYFRWCGYFQGPWVSYVVKDEFSVRVTKMAILSKEYKPDNFKSRDSLKISFTNICALV